MRWKLMFVAALVSGIAGTGLTLALIGAFIGYANPLGAHASGAFDFVALGALLIPLVAVALASVFVYRHTARRRKLQALVTAAVALVFTLTFFILGSTFFSRRHPAPSYSTPPPHSIS